MEVSTLHERCGLSTPFISTRWIQPHPMKSFVTKDIHKKLRGSMKDKEWILPQEILRDVTKKNNGCFFLFKKRSCPQRKRLWSFSFCLKDGLNKEKIRSFLNKERARLLKQKKISLFFLLCQSFIDLFFVTFLLFFKQVMKETQKQKKTK